MTVVPCFVFTRHRWILILGDIITLCRGEKEKNKPAGSAQNTYSKTNNNHKSDEEETYDYIRDCDVKPALSSAKIENVDSLKSENDDNSDSNNQYEKLDKQKGGKLESCQMTYDKLYNLGTTEVKQDHCEYIEVI